MAYWPFDIVQFDIATSISPTPNGNAILLVVIDVITGYTLLRPLPNKDSSTVAMELMKVFADFGVPRIIHTDNEPTLVSQVIEQFYKYLGTTHQTSIPYLSHSLGKAERAIGSALQCVHKLLSACGGDWDRMCPFAQLSLNTKIKELTGSDPFALMFNRVCNIFDFDNWSKDSSLVPNISAIKSLEHWQEHQKKLETIVFPAIRQRTAQKQEQINEAYAANHTPALPDLPIGTLVAIKDIHRQSKNEAPMLSPYTVHERASNGAYYLRDMAGGILKRAVPIEQIRPLFHATKPDTSETAYLDYIHDHRVTKGRDEYLVKWSGLPLSESAWVDFAKIDDYSAITQYLASRERIPKTRASQRTAVIQQTTKPVKQTKAQQKTLSESAMDATQRVVISSAKLSSRGRPMKPTRR